jgi:Tfp pilus assembly protein PilX
MPLFVNKNSEKGQVLLVVVLASVISLTVGLAAISRSITNTRVSTEESNSQKALAAAEAGIEEQLNSVTVALAPGKTLSNGSKFTATVTKSNLDPNFFQLNNGNLVLQDVGADVWLSDHTDFENPVPTTNLTIYWATGAADCHNDPAIEIAVISGAKNDPNMARYTVDACGSRQSLENHFSPPSGGAGRAGLNQRYIIPGAITDGRIVRIIPLYADAKIAVESTANLPAQGYIVSSTGTSGNTERKVRVYQGFTRLPIEFFPYNLFLP